MKSARFVAPLCLSFVFACGGAAPPPEVKTPEAPAAADAPTKDAAAAEHAGGDAPAEKAAEPAAAKGLEVSIAAKSGSTLMGTATFTEEAEGVKVLVKIGNAPPGLKGIHIHEKADCSAADGSSAGDHFNPDGSPHARPPDVPRHMGDLGNIGVTPEGNGLLEIFVKGANLKPGDPHSLLDRGLVIHKKRDDGGQPSGNAGERIGCAEIKKK